MHRLFLLLGAPGLVLLAAQFAGLSLASVLATLGIGLLTAVCLLPAVLVSEMISRRTGSARSRQNGAGL